MELKVWVEGIQRVVCGVTETSTCQDVVYALAHATGQTGRFTLIEKWRNSERLLAPQEQPLKVLIKWGEYANDVHFVMRKTTGDSKQSTNQPVNNNNKRQHDFLRSFSPSGCSNNNNSIGKTTKIAMNNNTSKEIKKSLTFSCGHGSSGSSVSSNENSAIISEQDTSLNKNIKNRSKQDLPKGVVRGIPQKPPRDSDSPTAKIERPKFPPSYDEALSRSSGRFSTSHLSIANSNQPDEESPSVKRPHLSNSSSPRPTTTFRSPERTTEVLSSPNRAVEKASVPDESLKLKKTLKFDKHETKPLSRKSTSSEEIAHDPQYQDLLRLVSLQREKLDNQQAELSQFDAEIVYWEDRLREQEEKLNLLQEEVCLLERTQHEQEGELIQLDRRSFTEEMELGRQEERTLRSELTLARSQLANCETEVLQCRQRIRLLLEEIAEGRRMHEEQQMDSIQRQIKEKILQADNQKCAADDAKEELQDLELKVADKQKEMDKLLAEIREANLHSLSLLPSEEGKKLFEGNFCNRPGSTRKIIGSPRQLENAVPTNKNPHGVWV